MTLPAIQYAKTTDGVNVAYFSVGEGPPIVFASNIFGDAHFYRHLAWHHVRGVTDGLVKRGWTVVRYDVRGMGASDRQADDLSLDAHVRDLEAVVKRLGLERFALAGLDIGAATAVSYVSHNAERVSQLVLLSPWISGAEMFALPDLRVASGMIANGDREWSVFTNVLGNVASAFEDVRLAKEMAAAMRASTDRHDERLWRKGRYVRASWNRHLSDSESGRTHGEGARGEPQSRHTGDQFEDGFPAGSFRTSVRMTRQTIEITLR